MIEVEKMDMVGAVASGIMVYANPMFQYASQQKKLGINPLQVKSACDSTSIYIATDVVQEVAGMVERMRDASEDPPEQAMVVAMTAEWMLTMLSGMSSMIESEQGPRPVVTPVDRGIRCQGVLSSTAHGTSPASVMRHGVPLSVTLQKRASSLLSVKPWTMVCTLGFDASQGDGFAEWPQHKN